MIKVKSKYITRSGRVATIVSDTSQNTIAAMAGFSFLVIIEDKINEQFFITEDGRKFSGIESNDDLIEEIEEFSLGDPSDPFFAMTNQLVNIETRWNLHGSMQFNQD